MEFILRFRLLSRPRKPVPFLGRPSKITKSEPFVFSFLRGWPIEEAASLHEKISRGDAMVQPSSQVEA